MSFFQILLLTGATFCFLGVFILTYLTRDIFSRIGNFSSYEWWFVAKIIGLGLTGGFLTWLAL